MIVVATFAALAACGCADEPGSNDENYLSEGIGESLENQDEERQLAKLAAVRTLIEEQYAKASTDAFDPSVDLYAFEELCNGEDYLWTVGTPEGFRLYVVEITFSHYSRHMAVFANEPVTFEKETFEQGELLHSASLEGGVTWAPADQLPSELVCGSWKK